MITYSDLDKMSWCDILEAMNTPDTYPCSVHIPLNFPEVEKFTFCDCAMNAYVLNAPALNMAVPHEKLRSKLQIVTMLSFAFGEVPYVPDFRQVRLSRIHGGLPIIRAAFTAHQLICLADYCVSPDGILHIRVTVKNEDAVPHKAHLWIRPQRQPVNDLMDYHYVSFNWDASRWRPDRQFMFDGENIVAAQGCVGKVTANDFEVEWVEKRDYTGCNPNAKFCCRSPYYVFPAQQLVTIQNVLHLDADLEAEEEKSFELALDFVNDSPCADVLAVPYAEAEATAIQAWRKMLRDKPVIDTGSTRENAVLEAVRLNDLQLLLKTDGDKLRPCQGGSSEIYFVWVWEALCAIAPLVKLGHFAEARKVIEYIFSYQDGGCPPVGNFTSLKGAIGTTGPKWASSTGAALILASEYLRCSHDRQFIEKHLDKLLAAARWIIGEIRATRVEGNPTYGVMPEARATDSDVGQLISTDAWSLSGLCSFKDALQSISHPAWQEIAAECKLYKKHLDAVLDRSRREDGFIARSYGSVEGISTEFRFVDTVLGCCRAANIASAYEPRMVGMLRWLEKNAFNGLFCGEVSHGIYYVGNCEMVSAKMYMELGEWKRAWAAARVIRKYGLTQDVFITQERYSACDCGFTPWQPNASNDGRFIDMQIARMFHCVPGHLILFGGYAPYELDRSPALHGVITELGTTELIIEGAEAVLHVSHPIPVGTEIRTQVSTLILEEPQTDIRIQVK